MKTLRRMILVMAICILTVCPGTAQAKTKAKAKTKAYTTSIARGVRGICYSKDTVSWKSDGSKILSYSGNQKRSGFLVTLKGIQKYKALSTSKKYALLCKHTLQIGAVYKGITLGWVRDVNDMLYINYNGTSSAKWDY